MISKGHVNYGNKQMELSIQYCEALWAFVDGLSTLLSVQDNGKHPRFIIDNYMLFFTWGIRSSAGKVYLYTENGFF